MYKVFNRGTPLVEEVPHGPGCLAGLAEGSGTGNADRGSKTVLGLDQTAFLKVHGNRRNAYQPRKPETTLGQVGRKVPRDRRGQHHPALPKPPMPGA